MSETFYDILLGVWKFYVIIISLCKILYYFNTSNKCVHTLIQ